MEITGKNTLLSWIGRTIDLSNVVSNTFKIHVQPSLNGAWQFERFYAAWDSTADDPSVFNSIEWRITWNQHNYNVPEANPAPLTATINPGLHDLTAATTRPKQYFFKSPRIGFTMSQQDVFQFHLQNFLGTGKPDEIELMFVGRRVYNKVF